MNTATISKSKHPVQASNNIKTLQFDEQDIEIQCYPDQVEQSSDFQLELESKLQPPSPQSLHVSKSQLNKMQIRKKVSDYLHSRKTQGHANPRMSRDYDEESRELDNRALMDELGCIRNMQISNREVELFILAFNRKPELAINQYIQKGIIKDSKPQFVAEYLIKLEGLDKEMLGQYFGKNDKNVLKVFHSYCLLLDFHKVEFDRAIRQLLGRFKLPGEAQQIERIIEEFSSAYFESNRHQHANADELFPLAFAIIMLATDAHNPKQERKMSKEEFTKNTRGACPSIGEEYLSGIYDRITKEKFETEVNNIETLYARLKGLNCNDFQTALGLKKELMKGDIFLKICRNTNKFVQRKIYLSQDQSRIEWISDPPTSQNQNPRFIFTADITEITLGLGSEVMKKNKVPKQFDSLCFTITTTHRTLDLKAKTNKQRANWVNYMRAILIQKRQREINKKEEEFKSRINRDTLEEVWNTEIFPHWDDHWDYKTKRPKYKNAIARGFQALMCCLPSFKNQSKSSSQSQAQFNNENMNNTNLTIKRSILQTLWKLGLPMNSRKVLWPLVIGNGLSLTQALFETIRKKVKKVDEFRKMANFDTEVIQLGQICKQFRPDIPSVRQILQISEVFCKCFSRGTAPGPAVPLLNLLHREHFLPFYRGEKSEIQSRIQLFEYLMCINCPEVRDHFEGLKLETRMFVVNWWISIFYECFRANQELLLRVWDNFLLEGELYLFKLGIGLIKYYEVELRMCTFQEGINLLRFPKGTSPVLLFSIVEEKINVKEEHYYEYIEKRRNAIIKTKVQSIPLE